MVPVEWVPIKTFLDVYISSHSSLSISVIMAPRANAGSPADEPDHSVIHNHRSKGLGIFDKSQVFHQLSNFNIKFVSELKDQRMDLMGYLLSLIHI